MIVLITTAAASLIGSGISALFSIGSTVAQNRYNSPKAQRRRLREAGLPLSYMFQGNVANQNTVPQLELDPYLGTAKERELDMSQADIESQILKRAKDMDYTDEQINKLKKEIEILGHEEVLKRIEKEYQIRYDEWRKGTTPGNRKEYKGQIIDYPDGLTEEEAKRFFDSELGETISNEQSIWENKAAIDKYNAFVKRNEGELKQIEYWVERNLFSDEIQEKTKKERLNQLVAMIKNLGQRDKVLEQIFKSREFNTLMLESLANNLKDKSDLEKGIVWALITLISKFGNL